MGRKSLLLVLVLSSFLLAAILVEAYGQDGGWKTIPNLKDSHVLEVTNFAVTQHNKLSKVRLVLVKLIRAEEQVVAGKNYRLVFSVKIGGGAAKPRQYEAIVYERPWEHFRKLTSFNEVKG